MKKRKIKSTFKPAFMALDMLLGIIIVTSVTLGLVSTVHRERTVESSLADSRSALHLAEHTLLNLQHGQPVPAGAVDIHPASGGIAPAGFLWAKVDANVHGHHQSLLGVIPIYSLPTEKQS
jgi:hypothetical protein